MQDMGSMLVSCLGHKNLAIASIFAIIHTHEYPMVHGMVVDLPSLEVVDRHRDRGEYSEKRSGYSCP